METENRVLFIEPPLSSSHAIDFPNHQFPLGFLYMAGVLEKNGFEVKILDCPVFYKQRRKIDEETIRFGLFPEQIVEAIKEFNPNVIGVSCSFTMFEPDAFEVIKLINNLRKKLKKDIKIVVGGAHVSASPEYVLRNKDIDIAVIGEGELTMLEIAERVKNKKRLDDIKGTALVLNKKIKINLPRAQIQDLDNYEPAWHLVDFNKYFEHPDNAAATIRSPSINMITSRGCPMKCTFCSVHTVWGRKWRKISAQKVVDQIEYLMKNKGVKHFRINDDNMTLGKDRIINICNEIIKRKLNIKWDTPSGVAFWTLDEEVLDIMKKSGYYRITFGIESASQETLKYIDKKVDLEKINKLIDYCHKIGLWVASFFIIGFPFEKEQEINKTIEYITNSKINFPFLYAAQPYMGTKMYHDFKNAGLLDDGFLTTSASNKTKYKTKYFSPEELNKIRDRAYKRFYLKKAVRYSNPLLFYREFLSKVRSPEDAKYVYTIITNLLTTFT